VSPISTPDAGKDAPPLDRGNDSAPDASDEDRPDGTAPPDAPALDRVVPIDTPASDVLPPVDRHATDVPVSADTCTPRTCNPSFSDCDGVCTNGCETDTRTSVSHCGVCGRPCVLARATTACTAGQCTITRCDPGFGDCDANPANGCETELTENASHCGRCGNACPSVSGAAGVCVSGTCAVPGCAARPGFGDCDMNAANGCEADVLSDACNCGACGRPCMALGVGMQRCQAGRCVGGPCIEGFADCDGRASNGCETPTASNRSNCGRCGNACRASEICTGGTCRCPLGQTSCAGACVNVQYDLAHCGVCGNACPAGQVCSRGSCASSCGMGETRCGDRCSDLNDSLNCGACGLACPSGLGCAFGRCGFLGCSTGLTSCNGVCVDTQTDTQNCGACGLACPSGSVCQFGACMNLACRRM
jgi:hypothetical protein